MRNLYLPNIHIVYDQGAYFLYDNGQLKELDGGYVNSLLEKISGMNYDETAEYLADNIKKMKFLRHKRGLWQRHETTEVFTE